MGDRPDLPSSVIDAAWDDELNTRPLSSPPGALSHDEPSTAPIDGESTAPVDEPSTAPEDERGGDAEAWDATGSFADTDTNAGLGPLPVSRQSTTSETLLGPPPIDDTTLRDPRPPVISDAMGGERMPTESAGEFGSTYVEARDWRSAAKAFAVAHAQTQGSERTERPAKPFVIPAMVEPTVMQWTPDDLDRTERAETPFVPPVEASVHDGGSLGKPSSAPKPPEPATDRTERPETPFVPPVDRTVLQAPMGVDPFAAAHPQPVNAVASAGEPPLLAHAQAALAAPAIAGALPAAAHYERADAGSHAPVSTASPGGGAGLSFDRLLRLPTKTLAMAAAGVTAVVVTSVFVGWFVLRGAGPDAPGPSPSGTPGFVPSGEAVLPPPSKAEVDEIEADARRALERLREGVTACVQTIGSLPGTSPAVPARLKLLREGPYESTAAEWRTPVWLCTKYRESGPQRFQIQWQQGKPGKAEGMGIAWIDADRDGAPDRALGFQAILKKKSVVEVGEIAVIEGAPPPVIMTR